MTFRAALLLAALGAVPSALRAQPAENPVVEPSAPAAESQQAGQEEAAPAGFWQRDTLSGDWGGLRRRLQQQGVTVTITESAELFGNLTGGIRTGAAGENLLLGQVDADLGRLMGWAGGRARLSAYDYAGKGLSQGYLGAIMGVSEIEAPAPSARVWEMWVEQSAFADALALRVGVLALDNAGFTTTDTSALFIGSTFGFIDGIAADLPAGGPIYPLSAPGVMLTLRATPAFSLMAAVVSGDPAGHDGATYPPEAYPTGTVFSFSGGALGFVQATLDASRGAAPAALPATFKLGAWYHTSRHFAEVATIGSAALAEHAGDWGVYATADGMLYRQAGTKDQGLAAFARVAAMPTGQNLIAPYFDAGLAYKGLLPGRDDDVLGIAFAWAHVSASAEAADRARQAADPLYPVRSAEMQLEVTYQAALTPWWTLQPDLQAWFHPGGGVLNPDGSLRRDALLLGLRTNVAF
jgi:porin